MAVRMMKGVRCPTDELSVTNRAIVCPTDFGESQKHIQVQTAPGQVYLFSVEAHRAVASGTIGFSAPQRKWMQLALNQEVEVRPKQFNDTTDRVGSIVLEADFLNKKATTPEPYNSDRLAAELLMQFPHQAVTVGQPMVFAVPEKKMLMLRVKSIEVVHFSRDAQKGATGAARAATFGCLTPNTVVTFEKAENSPLNLTGKAIGKHNHQSIISPDWDFNSMGIGGLDKEFEAVFRRAFTSRVFPPGLVEEMGMKHARGILLYGPPGTGKTLMARQIGKMLNAREPKIVNGPSILDKYVGETEAKIRALFAEAEEEQKRMGINSGLHIIIFDEIDAICKARGSVTGATAVHDTLVNQLLAKLDGVESLNNILVIGMTNRRDMIDEALLRPGRLEVHMEISLPDEFGRVQILNIHTSKIKEAGKLGSDVSIQELAANTKNFSGAEIEGLVRSAASTAMYRSINVDSKVQLEEDAAEKLRITRDDFIHALEEVKPAFGSSDETIDHLISSGIIPFSQSVSRVLTDAESLVAQVKNSDATPLITLLLAGPSGSGKTALAAQIAKNSSFPLVKICSPEEMVGFTESAKCHAIKKIFDDAYKSPLSCVIVDNIERLLDYVAIGPRFSNVVLQALLVLLGKRPPKGKRLLVIGTTSRKDVMDDMEITKVFSTTLLCSNLRTAEDLMAGLEGLQVFSKPEMDKIAKEVQGKSLWLPIKKLIIIAEFANQFSGDQKIMRFVNALQDEGALEGGVALA